MAQNSKIEWCHHTVNFWWGCEEVSPACAHCYARTLAKIFSRGRATWGANGLRWLRYIEAEQELIALQRGAAKKGVTERVFINSMSDTFEDRPELDQAREILFQMVDRCPNLVFLLLTKRPQNVMRMVPPAWREGFPQNVAIGTTVEDQPRADERLVELVQIPATIRFLSCEPMVGPVDLTGLYFSALNGGRYPFRGVAPEHRTKLIDMIHWVICGGESGPKARPMHPCWAYSLRDQCQAAGVPFLFKQWGEWLPFYDQDNDDPDCRSVPTETSRVTRLNLAGGQGFHGDRVVYSQRVGKGNAGRMLDGREWNEFPAMGSEVAK